MSRLPRVSSSAVLLVLCVLWVVSCCVGPAGATFVLDGWVAPHDITGLDSAEGSPQAVYFRNLTVVVYRSTTTLYACHSDDGVTFTPPAALHNTTNYDPALIIVKDASTGQDSLLLIAGVGAGSTTLGYAVWDEVQLTFPPFTTSGLTNVGGEVDGVYNPSTGKIVFVYVSSLQADSNGQYWCWTATAQLSSGVLTSVTSYSNLGPNNGGGTQCATGKYSQFATFANPATGTISFVQPQLTEPGQTRTGSMYFFTTVDPSTNQFYEIGLDNRIYPGNSTSGEVASGLSAVSFPLGSACSDLVAVFYKTTTGALGYTIVTQPTSGSSLQFGPALTVQVNGGSNVTNVGNAAAVYGPAGGQLFLYFVDRNRDPHEISVVHTTPTL